MSEQLLKDPELALAYTKTELQKLPAETWVIPQSGGKDSRAVAQSAMVLIERGEVSPPKRMVFIMADTVMEFWTFMHQAKQSLIDMTGKAKSLGINAEWHIARPIIQDDFWVRIIGRGMTPPTSNMRWCTDTLKVRPMHRLLSKVGAETAPVLLGVRYGESE